MTVSCICERSRGTQLEGYVITSLVQLLCRTTKLCWFDDDHFRTIVEDAKAFLTKGTGGSPASILGILLALCLLSCNQHNRSFPTNVVMSRITRLSLFCDTLHCCKHLWACSVQGHYLLGLKILNMLVVEFNQPTPGRTMTQHRKPAVAFRDTALFKVFQTAIASLQLLQSNAAPEEKLREQVLPGQPWMRKNDTILFCTILTNFCPIPLC